MKSAGSIQRTGEQSFKLVVSAGTGDDGKRIRKTKNIKVSGTSEKAQEQEAKRELALFLADVEQGKVAQGGNMLLRNFYCYWKENYALPHLEKTTITAYDYIFPRIDAALGHKKINQIEPKHVLLFLKNLSEPGVRKDSNASRRKEIKAPKNDPLSSSSIRKHFALLSTILSQAEKWRMIVSNPCKYVTPVKAEYRKAPIYDEETLGKFLTFIKEESIKHQLMVALALTGGLRREEIFGICWSDVDFTESCISINKASIYIPGGIITKGTKNIGSMRTVSVPESTMLLLKEHQKEQLKEKELLADKWVLSDRIFTKWNGEPAHPHSFASWLNRFTEAHELPHISPHSFRHMNATYLLTSGIDLRTVAGKLGHTQTSTTLNTYAQLLKGSEKRTAQTMENLLSRLQERKKDNQ